MTKLLKEEIETCSECPYLDRDYEWDTRECGSGKVTEEKKDKEGRVCISQPDLGKEADVEAGIPEWCPLPDLKEG